MFDIFDLFNKFYIKMYYNEINTSIFINYTKNSENSLQALLN